MVRDSIEPMRNLDAILAEPSDEKRRQLLIERGWELQREEAKTDEERDFCDWIVRPDRH